MTQLYTFETATFQQVTAAPYQHLQGIRLQTQLHCVKLCAACM